MSHECKPCRVICNVKSVYLLTPCLGISRKLKGKNYSQLRKEFCDSDGHDRGDWKHDEAIYMVGQRFMNSQARTNVTGGNERPAHLGRLTQIVSLR